MGLFKPGAGDSKKRAKNLLTAQTQEWSSLGKTGIPLYEYLGLTKQECARWLAHAEVPTRLIK